jgi:hypothetical protein
MVLNPFLHACIQTDVGRFVESVLSAHKDEGYADKCRLRHSRLQYPLSSKWTQDKVTNRDSLYLTYMREVLTAMKAWKVDVSNEQAEPLHALICELYKVALQHVETRLAIHKFPMVEEQYKQLKKSLTTIWLSEEFEVVNIHATNRTSERDIARTYKTLYVVMLAAKELYQDGVCVAECSRPHPLSLMSRLVRQLQELSDTCAFLCEGDYRYYPTPISKSVKTTVVVQEEESEVEYETDDELENDPSPKRVRHE